MKITALPENTTAREDMQVEHGLSLFIETGGHRILFDMGQTDLFYENARVLGINPAEADLAVLSHGHYDHGGGLRKFFEINPHAPVYIHRDAFLPHYTEPRNTSGLTPPLRIIRRSYLPATNTALMIRLRCIPATAERRAILPSRRD